MCDLIQILGIGSEVAREGASISNAVEKERREEQTKEARNKIQSETDAEITKQTNQFGDNGDVVVTNPKQTTTTQPQKRKQLISLRLNDVTQQKPTTPQNNNLGLNI